MNIGIIGTGNMGRTLGLALAERGHDVCFGARETRQAATVAALATRATHGTNRDAAAFGEVLFWTPRDADPREVLGDPSIVRGKIVLDPNNAPVPRDHRLGPPAGARSHAERLASTLVEAHVVKAFNTMAQEVLELPPAALRAAQVTAFLAGDDAAAKQVAAELARDLGLVPLDMGPLVAARLLEGVADFVRLAMGTGLGVGATLSVRTLDLGAPRFGGRQPSRLA